MAVYLPSTKLYNPGSKAWTFALTLSYVTLDLTIIVKGLVLCLDIVVKDIVLCLDSYITMDDVVSYSFRLDTTGALQGLNKQEMVDKHGKEQVLVWRRSYNIPPPEVDESSEHYLGNDPTYKDVPKDILPKAESLKLTEERL